MKPNLFSNAPNELAQDGFFVWLMQWADPSNRSHDESLHALAQDLVRVLMGVPDDFMISKVEAGRQWEGVIDLWAEINDEHFLLIEDKTDTSEHSDQLQRYRKMAEDHYLPKQFKLHLIYLKTGNESDRSLDRIVEKGFRVIGRRDILATFDRHQVTNHIHADFSDHLRNIERESSSYVVHARLLSNWHAAQGFCAALQKIKGGDADWGYVANPNGGFLGFWYFWRDNTVFGEIYIQIENAFDRCIQVVIKVADWDENIDHLYGQLEILAECGRQAGVTLVKPRRYRAGATSTLAIAEDIIRADPDGMLNWAHLQAALGNLEKAVERYCAMTQVAPESTSKGS